MTDYPQERENHQMTDYPRKPDGKLDMDEICRVVGEGIKTDPDFAAMVQHDINSLFAPSQIFRRFYGLSMSMTREQRLESLLKEFVYTTKSPQSSRIIRTWRIC
jgi:hypothetical protein